MDRENSFHLTRIASEGVMKVGLIQFSFVF